MAHFYGTLQGARGQATRGGSKSSGIESYTASWEGAVNVRLWYDAAADVDMAEVSLVKWHGRGASHLLYHGPVGPLNGLKVLDEKDGRANPSLRACEYLEDTLTLKDQYGSDVPSNLVVLDSSPNDFTPADLRAFLDLPWYEWRQGAAVCLLVPYKEGLTGDTAPEDAGLKLEDAAQGNAEILYVDNPLKRYSAEDGFYHA